MPTSQEQSNSAGNHLYQHQLMKPTDSYNSHYKILQSNSSCLGSSHGTNVSFGTSNKEKKFFTLESSQPNSDFLAFESPSSASVSSNIRSPFSRQLSQDSASSVVVDDDRFELKKKLRELEISLLGPESDIVDSCQSFSNGVSRYNWGEIQEMIPKMDLKEILIKCAQAVSDDDIATALGFMNNVLEKMVSVGGEPSQRLGAYMLEGLRARLESSGSAIYKSFKCEEPTSKELMSYMYILYQICPYWKFAYLTSNVAISEAMKNESRIHIIDFQIAQGTQWLSLMEALARRPGRPPFIRVTGVDDFQSLHARGGGLDIVGKKLMDYAKTCGIPFEFNSVTMFGCEVQQKDFVLQNGEALAVNFPFTLHHMPDESVSTENHRDRLLRLVKSLSPKVVLLVEQESNTNTSPFFHRFVETMNYYTAMFESIDVALPRDDKTRISVEQHCVARDIVNMIACEGNERVERHEMFGKWKARLLMAGFVPLPLSPSVTASVTNLLKEFNENYRIEQTDVALYLAWKSRALATFSVWKPKLDEDSSLII
ncbi:unnamed protein product [Vicia faba]|uniref:Uncharacterized protein n=1 Tax=Vicia faba TaxID=3906 RepID=A0AAV0YWI0_VICFA|nr:unnamed protein product [Vicia faba]